MAGLLRTRCAALAHQIAGFVLDSQWHALLGLALVVAAKMLGTAAVAWLFSPTHPTLMRLPWFANLYRRWKPWQDRIIAQMKASAS